MIHDVVIVESEIQMETESSPRQSKRSWKNNINVNSEREEDASPVAVVDETENIKKLFNGQQQVDERDKSAVNVRHKEKKFKLW